MRIEPHQDLQVNHAAVPILKDKKKIHSMNSEQLVLTLQECASLFKVSEVTWRRWLNSGLVPLPRKIGHLLRWYKRTPIREELEAIKSAIKNQRRFQV